MYPPIPHWSKEFPMPVLRDTQPGAARVPACLVLLIPSLARNTAAQFAGPRSPSAAVPDSMIFSEANHWNDHPPANPPAPFLRIDFRLSYKKCGKTGFCSLGCPRAALRPYNNGQGRQEAIEVR